MERHRNELFSCASDSEVVQHANRRLLAHVPRVHPKPSCALCTATAIGVRPHKAVTACVLLLSSLPHSSGAC